MQEDQQTQQDPAFRIPPFSARLLEPARGRLSDRGIDPDRRLGVDELGAEITTARFYLLLGIFAASEKAGQGPTYAIARLALRAGLPREIADTLFLAYNQQSAEEAGHGDKVFGNAYYSMGGVPTDASLSVFGDGGAGFLEPDSDPRVNRQRLEEVAAVLGGIETVALQRALPNVNGLCERWNHPIGNDVMAQIRDVVRPEESRHVLNYRYVFHRLIAPAGQRQIDAYFHATNAGRMQLDAPPLDRDRFARTVGASAPTATQLLGKR
jgi:hypothetical protein